MKVRTALLVILCTALSEACQRPEDPVRGTFGPYEIVFPQTVQEAKERYKVEVDSFSFYRYWRRDSLRLPILDIGRRSRWFTAEPDLPLYSITFFVPRQQVDSLRQVLAQQWGGQWQPRRTTSGRWGLLQLDYEHLAVEGPLDITIQPFQPSRRVIAPTFKVSFCYGLSEKELNFFVARQGDIFPDD
jgi:hypothetical protein